MDYGKCYKCKKIIKYDGVCICENCEEEELKKIKDFLDENGEQTIDVINKETNVSKKLLIKLYNEGRLYSLSEEEKNISKEEYARRRKLDILNQMSYMYNEEKNNYANNNARMHVDIRKK